MMANDDAERLLEENFIMTEEDPFDGADDTSIPHVPGLKKYKKKQRLSKKRSLQKKLQQLWLFLKLIS